MKKLYYITTGLAVIFAMWFAVSLYTYFQRADDTRETLRQSAVIDRIFEVEAEPVQIARLAMANNDIIAHLYIPGTAISYAVVQTTDNEFYLYHDLRKHPNANGAIFLDYLNNPDFSDKSTIIYGHNRSDGTMFYDLQLFQDYGFFRENETIVITTADGTLLYKIFAVFAAHISFNYIKVEFSDNYEFLALVHEMKDRAMHLRDVSLSAESRTLILSTCTGLGLTGRLVLVAKFYGNLDNVKTRVIS